MGAAIGSHWQPLEEGESTWYRGGLLYESSIARGVHCYTLRVPSSEGVLSNGHNVPV